MLDNNLIDNHYFTNILYFKHLLNNKTIELSPVLPYQKGWFCNKTTIAGANRAIVLSVPIEGGRNQKSLYGDVKISYGQPWQHQHLKAIKSAYGNAPFFDFYIHRFEEIFNARFTHLFELNTHILKKMLELLKSDCQVIITDEPTSLPLFSKQNPGPNTESAIKYTQVFEDRLGFIPNLSIIDLLMCCGPQAKNLLLQEG